MNNDAWKRLMPQHSLIAFVEEQQRLRQAFDPSFYRVLQDMAKQRELVEHLVLRSPAYQLVEQANWSLSRLIEPLRGLAGIAPQTVTVHREWNEPIRFFEQSVGASHALEEMGRSHIAWLTEISIAAEARLARVPWETIGATIGASTERRAALQQGFIEFTESYARFYDSLARSAIPFVTLPPVVTSLPPVELLAGVELLRLISIPPGESDEHTEEFTDIDAVLISETEASLESQLIELGSGLLGLLQGARAAARSTNPDQIRHVSISLRELLTQVLHQIAPDAAIRKWTSAPEDYHNGTPTRRARLLYVCRAINHGLFTTFVQKDTEATLKFVQLLQEGTHRVPSIFSEPQLSAMILRMEGLLRFLLAIAKGQE